MRKDEIQHAGKFVETILYRWNKHYLETVFDIFFQSYDRWRSAFGEFKEVKRFIKWQQLQISIEVTVAKKNNLPMVVENPVRRWF